MIAVTVAAMLFALVLVVVVLGFAKWAFRALERKDRVIEQLRVDTLERYGFLVGKNLEATPRERRADLENNLHQLERDLATARIIEDPTQTIEYPSPSEARFREKEIAARFGDNIVDIGAFDREPLLVGPEVEPAR